MIRQMSVAPDAVGSADLFSLALSLGTDPTFSECLEFERHAEEIVLRACRDGDPGADLELHRFLYEVNAHRILPPWSAHWHDYEHPVLLGVHRKANEAWAAQQRRLHGAGLDVPTDAGEFITWATEICQTHASGVTHPLFDFLANDATFDELREFLSQETPFDIHFGDLIALLLPGVHGHQKTELAVNFWDEMGQGKVTATHRQLRLSMMERVGIVPGSYIEDVRMFWVEELRLANMYFQTSADRRLAPQAIGMLMATELVVPGRIDRQIDGWRRLGLQDDEMRYLLEHVTVDVEHAQGWIDHVVIPLAKERPDLLPEIAIGVLRRLDAALDVCDRAVREFASMAVIDR
jgi:pyrroloquinoline quinone (PQQ) biosynthesis protein C